MSTSLRLGVVLVLTLFVAACGASGEQQGSGEADAPPESAPTQEAEAPGETRGEDAPPEAAPEETQAGPSATTVTGETVTLGGESEATALYFMAGW